MKDFLQDIARQAGDITLDYRGKLAELPVNRKSEKDLITAADIAVEEYLVGAIRARYPDHAITGEETGDHAGGEYRWIIDPIDGTASFVHGQPMYSVSIAVARSGRTVLGAVNIPVMGQQFFAARDAGAFCNGERIGVSRRARLVDCMLATGFACLRSNMAYNNLSFFVDIAPRVRDIRRYGSAAADLCYVAAGLFDGFWELNLKEVDVAAGALVVEEAGGRVTDFAGTGAEIPGEVVATNSLIHDRLLECLADVKRRGETQSA